MFFVITVVTNCEDFKIFTGTVTLCTSFFALQHTRAAAGGAGRALISFAVAGGTGHLVVLVGRLVTVCGEHGHIEQAHCQAQGHGEGQQLFQGSSFCHNSFLLFNEI